MRSRHLLVAAVTAVALIGACSACEPAQVVDVEPGSLFQPATLTDDNGDRYQLAGDIDQATVTAPASNTGGNTRITWTLAWRDASLDHTVCATWTAAADSAQEGVMLRWDGTRGITLTKGVWGAVYTVINVHTWDTTLPVDQGRFTQVAQFPLTGIGWPSTTARPLPWRMCATATGPTVRFKVWPLDRPEPADTDPCCTGATTITDTWAGRPGWYAGHLAPGGQLVYTDLTTEVAG